MSGYEVLCPTVFPTGLNPEDIQDHHTFAADSNEELLMNPYSDCGPKGAIMNRNPATSTLVATLLALAIPVSGTAQESIHNV
jgi:hypothetical protein